MPLEEYGLDWHKVKMLCVSLLTTFQFPLFDFRNPKRLHFKMAFHLQ